jgi:hypothetical protein
MMNLMIIHTYLYISITNTFINEASQFFNLDFEADARHQTAYEPVHVSVIIPPDAPLLCLIVRPQEGA